MTRFLFVCHGNICRSTMAQFVMQELVRRVGREDDFEIDSAVTSREELGISIGRYRARQVMCGEYADWDYIIYMDEENAWGLNRILHGDPDGKVSRLLDWMDSPRDVADPWYTGDFDATYADVLAGCQALLAKLERGCRWPPGPYALTAYSGARPSRSSSQTDLRLILTRASFASRVT